MGLRNLPWLALLVAGTIAYTPNSAKPLVVDGTDVYGCFRTGSIAGGLLRFDATTGAPSDVSACEAFTLTKQHIVSWFEGKLSFIPRVTGPMTTVVIARPISIAPDGEDVYLGMSHAPGSSAVIEASLDRTTTVIETTTDEDVRALAVDGPNVYYTDGSRLARAPKRGDEYPTILETGLGINALLVDGDAVIWSACGDDYRGLIVRTPK